MKQVWQFFEPDGPIKLIFLYQIPEEVNATGDLVPQGNTPKLMLTEGDVDRIHGGKGRRGGRAL